MAMLFLAFLLNGGAVSGDRMRANHYSERMNDPEGENRSVRHKWTLILFAAGILCVSPSIIIFFFK
ncbi:hypothetical protein [Paenibacillus sambharensis]|uniref:hypothetical protein n=1 Tax=Paenibacillus sambharensis TaxID=1803190 RepID=UPI003CCC7F43